MSPKTREVLVYQWSNVHVFKEVYQRTKFSQITNKGMEGERMHVVFGLIGLEPYRRIMGKNFKKSSFSKSARTTAYRFMSCGHLHKSCHPRSWCLY